MPDAPPSMDPDKIPDAPRDWVTYAGVKVESRYGKARELETMMAALDYLIDVGHGVARAQITKIWCDSKASACYTVTVRDLFALREDQWQCLSYAFQAVDYGHNGIEIEALKGRDSVTIDPEWPDNGPCYA